MFFGKFPIRPVVIKSVQRLVTDDEQRLRHEASSLGLIDIPSEWLTPAIIESRTVLFEHTARFGAPRNPTSGPVGSDSHAAALSRGCDLLHDCVHQEILDVHHVPSCSEDRCVVPVCDPTECISQIGDLSQSLSNPESLTCQTLLVDSGIVLNLELEKEKCEKDETTIDAQSGEPVQRESWLDTSVFTRRAVAVMRSCKMRAAADHGFICSQCWVPLDDNFNCTVEENNPEGRCRLCVSGQSVPLEVKEIVMFQLEKECSKCLVLLNEMNCTKSQYRRTRPRCMACTDQASAHKQPALPKLDAQELIMKNRFETLQFDFRMLALDFECVEGDWRKVTQCGITYFNSVCERTTFQSGCGALIVENLVIVDNIDSRLDDLPEDTFEFGQTKYITFEDFLTYLNYRIHCAKVVVVYDSNLEAKLLNLWGCDASKILDLQLVAGIDSRKKISLSNLMKKYGYTPRGMHCAGNDSYWIFVVHCRVAYDAGLAPFSKIVNMEVYSRVFEWVFSSADFDEFLRFQLKIFTCDSCSSDSRDFMTRFRRMTRHVDDFDRVISYVRAYICSIDSSVSVEEVGSVT